MTATVAPWVWSLAAYGLPGSHALDADAPWGDRLDDTYRHGLTGLLWAAWSQGAVNLDDHQIHRLQARLEQEATLAVRLEAELARLAPVLERHDAVVLKGAALAHGAYPDPRWRPFSDLDLLVASTSVPWAIRDLARLGYQRPRPDPTPGYAQRVAKATALVHPSGLIVDLHRTLVAGAPSHHIDIDNVLASRIEVSAGSIAVPAPAWSTHLIEVCLHAVVGDRMARALSIRDVAQVATRADLDLPAVARTAAAWGVTDIVGRALRATHELLAVDLPPAFDPWLVASGAAEDFAPVDQSVASARSRLDEVRHGALRQRSTLVRSLVAPTPTFLRWTYGPAPLPLLYFRRWSDLRHRTADAGRLS